MARLNDALMEGAYKRDVDRPVINLAPQGSTGTGVWGYAPADIMHAVTGNQAYITRPIIPILLEAPRMFTVLPESDKWISSLKALVELHCRSIDGLNATLSVTVEDHPFGGAGEIQQEITNVTRERSQPKFTFIEKYGRPIQLLLDYWIRYGGMDPDTKFGLLGTLDVNQTGVSDLLNDWFTMSMLFMQPDPLHRKVDRAWICTNMFPMSAGEYTGKRDLTSAQEMQTLDVEFTSIAQVGVGVNHFAQTILDGITVTNADPFMRESFIQKVSPDVDRSEFSGYKSWAEQLSKTAVSNMAK